MASSRRSRKSTKRVAFGSFLKSSHFKGKKLVSAKGGRYRVKGISHSFGTFHKAKEAANRIAYGSSARRARKPAKAKSRKSSRKSSRSRSRR